MSSDRARKLFGAAYDGALEPSEQAAFERALDADPELRAAYDSYVRALQVVRKLDTHDHVPDLLTGVQAKLHTRSAGRYYRDRFSREAARRAGAWRWPLLVSLLMLGLLAIGWWVAL